MATLAVDELRAVLSIADALSSVGRDVVTFGDVTVLNVAGMELGKLHYDGQIEPNGDYVFLPK